MKANNKLTSEFLTRHPAESARVLEQLPSAQVAAFLMELETSAATSVIAAMLPEKTAACCEFITAKQLAIFVSSIPTVTAAGILRLLTKAKRDEIAATLSDKSWREIKRHLKFSSSSVGARMNSQVNILPAEISVAEAVKRVAHFSGDHSGEIYITDNNHRLVGSIEAVKLLKSSQHVRLTSVMNSKVKKLSALADAATLVNHPGWLKHRRLPVVDRDQTLVGVLDYDAVQEANRENVYSAQPRPLENLMALGVFYWIHAAQLLVGIFSVVTRGQEEKS